MFALIPVVISIVLMAILAIGSMFYGGSMFTDSASNANASSLINQAQQISSAAMLYELDNGGIAPADIDILVNRNYLQGIPVAPDVSASGPLNWSIVSTKNLVQLTGVESVKVCNLVNEKSGVETTTGAITTVDVDGDLLTLPYGCVLDGTNLVFQFRF